MRTYRPKEVDVVLTETLQRFAIDLDKIAISGRCGSGPDGLMFGFYNPQVFSRIATISGVRDWQGGWMPVLNQTAELFIDNGFPESLDSYEAAEQYRRAGLTVQQTITIRGHEDQVEDYDAYGGWLATETHG